MGRPPPSGVNVTFRSYSGWLPIPAGHHSFTCVALAFACSVTFESPFGTSTFHSATGPHDGARLSVPRAAAAADRKTRTPRVKPP